MLKTVVAICLLFAFPAQRPARDARLPASTATDGIVYGTVFSSSAGVLPATTVVLASQELNRSWRALTNDAGGFRFESLPPGTYTLTAMHPQYLPAHYGQTFVGQEGRALRLAPGESTRADLVAVKGSAITGTVFDVYGNPAMDVQVQAYRLQNINGRRQLQPVRARTYRSNDIGQYRISGLAPGTYYLAVQPLLKDVAGATAGSAPGFAITWYPGSLQASTAQPVRVPAETEVPLPSVRLIPVTLTHIAGMLTVPPGVDSGSVTLQLLPRSEFDFTKKLRGAIDESGRFLFERVPPGTYDIYAMSGGMPQYAQGPLVAPQALYAHASVQVDNGPVEGVSLVLAPPNVISGRIEADAPLPASAQIVVNANYDDENLGQATSSVVDKSGVFKLPAAAGLARLSVSGLPVGWVVEQIRGGGRDLELDGADIRRGGVFGVVVSLSSRSGQVSGTIPSTAGSEASDVTVVLMTADVRRRTQLLAGLTVVRPDSRGGFVASGLRPGRYIVAAVDFISPSQYYDPAVWSKLESAGQTVDLERGASVTISPPFVKLLR